MEAQPPSKWNSDIFAISSRPLKKNSVAPLSVCTLPGRRSSIIADLEDELGTALFERLNQRVKLTAAGRAFLPQLQTMMSDLSRSLVMVKRVGEGKTGALQIGYGTLTLLHPLFRAAVREFP